MLPESLVDLAASGAGALVQAAGSDAWTRISGQVARWFARGEARTEQGELERLRQSAAEIAAASGDVRVLNRQEEVWRERMVSFLRALDDVQRSQAAAELKVLVGAWQAGAPAAPTTTVQAHNGVASLGNGAINTQNHFGDVHIGFPPQADRSQG